ncbi:MAG: ABC transporter substrate-binding protein [Proteobacteria bacterium]|nr:ABC transporter substrate-binding protein [Pseudomonadota bacterium]
MSTLTLNGCTRQQEPLLRVASNAWPGYETLYLARSLGYYDDQLIRLVEIPSNSQVLQALRNGMIEAACLTLDEAITLIQDGMDLRVVLVMDVSHGGDVLMASPGIDTLQSLRGKRVGVENAAVGAIMLDAALEAGKLQDKDITIVPLTVDEHAAAYLAGKIDAAVTFEPVRSQLLQAGAHILFDSSQIPGRIIDVLVVRAEIAPLHKKALKNLLKGHFRARDYLTTQPQDAEKRLAPRLGNNALAQFTGLNMPDIQENQTLLGGNPPPLQITAGTLAELMLQRKLLQGTVSVDRLVDPSFLPAENE